MITTGLNRLLSKCRHSQFGSYWLIQTSPLSPKTNTFPDLQKKLFFRSLGYIEFNVDKNYLIFVVDMKWDIGLKDHCNLNLCLLSVFSGKIRHKKSLYNWDIYIIFSRNYALFASLLSLKCFSMSLVFYIRTIFCKTDQTTGVNFINVTHTCFLYKRHFGSFFYVHVTCM